MCRKGKYAEFLLRLYLSSDSILLTSSVCKYAASKIANEIFHTIFCTTHVLASFSHRVLVSVPNPTIG